LRLVMDSSNSSNKIVIISIGMEILGSPKKIMP